MTDFYLLNVPWNVVSVNLLPENRECFMWNKRILKKRVWHTVRFPRFFTLHTRWTVLPTSPVMLDGTDVSKYGPVPGVGHSCRKSVRNLREPVARLPVEMNAIKKNTGWDYQSPTLSLIHRTWMWLHRKWSGVLFNKVLQHYGVGIVYGVNIH